MVLASCLGVFWSKSSVLLGTWWCVCVVTLLWPHQRAVGPLWMEAGSADTCRREETTDDFCQDLILPRTPGTLKPRVAAWFQRPGGARVGSFSYKHSVAGCTHK